MVIIPKIARVITCETSPTIITLFPNLALERLDPAPAIPAPALRYVSDIIAFEISLARDRKTYACRRIEMTSQVMKIQVYHFGARRENSAP